MSVNNANLYAHFQTVFLKYPQKIVLRAPSGEAYSYRQLDQESARIANYLTELGVQIGDRVSVQVEKSPEAVFLYLACLRAGFVFHPLNTGYKAHELEYFLTNAEPKVVVCDEATLALMSDLAAQAGVASVLSLNADGSGSLIDASNKASCEHEVVERNAEDLAALLYSSGTTGVPKGIMLAHRNLLSNALSLVEGWGFTEQDTLLHALPIFHVHGLFVALGCVFLSGASMNWLATFDLAKVVDLLPSSTAMMGVPTYYTRLLSAPELNRDLVKNIRLFVSGSAPLLEETFNAFEARTGHRILERYGMTETNMNTSNPLVGERKAGTVGLPLPGVSVRVVNTQGKPLAADEIGDLQIKGQNVFKGYWRMPEKTKEDFTEDGFFNTGDKGKIDADGYVSIVGRAKDMVISGGLNVYPKEVELLIDDLQGVKESAVVGITHPDFGEAVVAVVVTQAGLQPTEAALITELKAQLAAFKVPKRIVFIDELPRNTMGKVQKKTLRDKYAAIFTE